MDTIENGVLVTTGKADEGSGAGYAAVQFNALKHGVLSRHVVLPHEDRAEFDELRDALVFEHQPFGATELHLVEELAGVLWRKRRVLMAEGAKINEGLKSAVNSPKLVMPSAAPFQRGLTDENADLRDLLDATPEEIVERQRVAALDLVATQKAAAILRKGGPSAYTKARRALIQDSRDWWDQQVEEEEHPATAEGLAQFIRDALEPICHQMVKESQYTSAIRAQTLGEGLRAHLLENLNRYETHLDRKFERTLAMLLKLKDLRGA
ncbi:MAG: hypothetical protein AW12_00936 [Candidatus Accumulibacter sp. BA-94]|uniref:hypothetical protein n=1 Tax=Accumulibacter sp. TaxID=2053492 RepID=UPI0004456B25|nr:hypothetical protein [Accumulibacter sp.]EXI91948.1 MAG: hypothetical protein AW12_00936 [Candidatus Accumulibacter sp. BA-94]HRD88752.1 hypothetical protein [Accumulibacter sp.]